MGCERGRRARNGGRGGVGRVGGFSGGAGRYELGAGGGGIVPGGAIC